MTLIEKKCKDSSTEPSEEIISDEEKVAEIFNIFVDIVPNLKTPTNHNCNMDFQKSNDPLLNAINIYKYHLSVPSQHVIFQKYSLSVPSAFQCSGDPGNI